MSIIVRYGIGQSMTKNIDLPIQQAITKFKIDIQDGTNLNKFVRIKVNYNTKQGTYLTFLKDKVGSAETFEVVKDKNGKPVFLQFNEVSKLEENKEQQIMQRITESQLRTIIKKELTEVLKEANFINKLTGFITGFKGLGQGEGESKAMSTHAARAAADAPTPKIELPKVLNEVVKEILTSGIDIRKMPQSTILSELNPMVEEFIGVGRKISESKLEIIEKYITKGFPALGSAALVYSFKFKNNIGNNTSNEYNIYIPFTRNQFASLDKDIPPVLKARESATGMGAKEIEMELQDWKTLILIYNEKKAKSETQR